MNVHPIEAESYRILESRVDLSRWQVGARDVVARMIHASADVDYADTTVIGSHAVVRGIEALRAGAPVITDVEMVRAGLGGLSSEVVCYLGEAVATDDITRSAAAMRIAADHHPVGAIVVVGCAPTALVEAIELDWSPALIVGLPVGFVGATESKEELRRSRFSHIAITNVGEKGGSAVAAAAVNALARFARA
jgi:precorrin-8X/cobalt-precorrin-8 methylmutase